MSEHDTHAQASWLSRMVIRWNNWRRRHQHLLVRPQNILLLLPRCLQSSHCVQNIARDIYFCRRCGQCKIKNVLELADELGVVPFVATGGRIAEQKLREAWVLAVVAVACEGELRAGIFASPKPVLAVANQRPHGPCFETDVSLDDLRRAIITLIRGE